MTVLLVFLAIAYVLTWSLWFASTGIASPIARAVVFNLGVFVPGILSLAMTAWTGGRDGVAKLLRTLVEWDVSVRWYVFAAGYMFSIKVLAALIHRAAFGVWPRFGDLPVVLLFGATAVSWLTGGQAGEELGWRGFALPRLAATFGLGAASVVLGVVWACWHLPLFFLPGFDTFNQSFPQYLLQVVAVSVAMAWLWGNTRGSLFLTMLLHAAVNNTKDIVPSADPAAVSPWTLSHSAVAWITAALLWASAVFFLRTMPKPS
jgi:CAAX protease family protein